MADNLFSLDGRVALVTGGNSGIGREIALALRDAGARVAIGARRADRNAAVLAELGPESVIGVNSFGFGGTNATLVMQRYEK